jgi:hypothetical protein
MDEPHDSGRSSAAVLVGEPRVRAVNATAAPARRPDLAERAGTALYARLPWLVLGLFVAWLLTMGEGEIIPDSWLGLAGGRELLQHGFSTTNTWTRYGSREWVDQQWGAHLVFYAVWRLAGAIGLVALNIALISSGLILIMRAAFRRGAEPAWTSLVLVVALLAANVALWDARAQSFSVLGFGLLAWLLTRDDGRLERPVFLAIPLIALWANLHAAVLVGGGICGVYAVSCLLQGGRRVRARALGLAVGAGLACFATPFVAGLPWYLRRTMDNPDFRAVLPEWHVTTPAGSPLFVLGAAAALALSVWAPMPRRDRVLLWLLTIAGFTAVRSQVWASLEWLVVLPAALQALRPLRNGTGLRRLSFATALGLVAALTGALVYTVSDGHGRFAGSWPPAAARIVDAAVKHDPRLKVYADQPLADWLLFTAPAVRGRLAIDGRYEVFDHRTFEEVDALAAQPVRIAPRIAAEDMYVLAPTLGQGNDLRLVRVLERDPGLELLFRSSKVVILRRR